MPTGNGVTVVITGVDDTSKVLDQIEQRMTRAAGPAASLGRNLGDGMQHAVPQVAAASAAIRTFEGAIPIRAVERLLTMIPGVGAALQAAFPVIGGLVFGEMILENVKKLHDLYVAAQDTAHKTGQAFGEASDKIREEANQIQISNDRLEEQIAKLEHKPSNGLKLAIDEALESAQKLGQQLREDAKTIEGLTKDNQTGFFANLLGQASTDKDAKDITTASRAINDQAQLGARNIEDLRDRGASQDGIRAAEEHNLSELQKVYDRYIPRLRDRKRQLENLQQDKTYKAFGGDDQQNRINMLGGALDIFDQQQRRAGAGFYNEQLKGTLAKDEAGKTNDEAAQKAREAAEKLAESRRKLQAAMADEAARQQKGSSDEELAALDASHKALLVSDEAFYRQRLQIQERANADQVVAGYLKVAGINTQINGLNAEHVTGNDATARDAKVNDLMAERLKIVGQIATIEADTAKKQTEAQELINEAQQRQISQADAVRARLEQMLGGSTAARLQQSRDAYYGPAGQRQKLIAQGVDPTEADRLQGLDEQRIQAQGADEDYQRSTGVLGAARQSVAYRQRSGAITSSQALAQDRGIDAEQSDQLQKVVDAYQQLANAGDLNAAAKIAELKEQILELRNPIDETASALRDGFDGAISGLVENLGEGTKAFDSFFKSIQRTVAQYADKQFIQPGLQQALGSIFPNRQKQPSLAQGVDLGSVVHPTVSPALSAGGGLLGDLGVGGGKQVMINITLTQDQNGDTSITDIQKQNDPLDQFEAHASQSFGNGGMLYQLFKGFKS